MGRALTIASLTGARIEVFQDPLKAVEDAEAVYTDVWVSMGEDAERAGLARKVARLEPLVCIKG